MSRIVSGGNQLAKMFVQLTLSFANFHIAVSPVRMKLNKNFCMNLVKWLSSRAMTDSKMVPSQLKSTLTHKPRGCNVTCFFVMGPF